MADTVGLKLLLEAEIKEFDSAIDALEKRVDGLSTGMDQLSSSTTNLNKGFNKLTPGSRASLAGITNLEDAVKSGAAIFTGYVHSLEGVGKAAASSIAGNQAASSAAEQVRDAVEGAAEGNESVTESISGPAGAAAATALITGLFVKFAFSGLSLSQVLEGTTVALSETEKAQSAFNKEISQSEVDAKAEINTLESLVAIASDELRSREERTSAVKVLNDKYPEYLKNLTDEKIGTDEATTAIANQVDLLLTKSQVLGAQKAYEKALGVQAEASYNVEQKRLEAQKEATELAGGQTNFFKEQVRLVRDVVNSIKENGISNKGFSIIEKASKDLTDANTLVDVFKSNLDNIIDSASGKGFLDKILGSPEAKDKQEKKVKTVADVVKTLDSALTAIDAQAALTGATFDSVAKDKITSLQKAFEDLIKLGLKPTSPEIQNIATQMNALGDKILGDKPIVTKLVQGLGKQVKTTKVKTLTPDELSGILGIPKGNNLYLDYKAKPEVVFEETPGIEHGKEAAANFAKKNAEIAAAGKVAFDKNYIQWGNALDQNLGPAIVDLGSQIQGAVSSAAVGIGEAIGGLITGKNGLESVFGGILGLMADFIVSFGKSLIEAATLRIIAEKALLVNPYLALAAGIGAVAIGTALKNSIPAFAGGGTVTGPTMAMVGDNPSGVEYMIPKEVLDRLKGGSRDISGTFVVKGSDLVSVLGRAQKEQKRYK